MSTLDDVVGHLESHGYSITAKDQLRLATHTSKLNMTFRMNKGGILFTAFCRTQDQAKKDRKGFLDFLNQLNAKASVVRFYADSDSDLAIEAWYPDQYDRGTFGTFLDAWETESTLMVLAMGADGIKYLR
jgi:hypothetical protein